MPKTCSLKITFNGKTIKQIVITEHYQEKHSKVINDQLILKILENNLNGKRITPELNHLEKEIFVWTTNYQNKNYRLVFWYDNIVRIINFTNFITKSLYKLTN